MIHCSILKEICEKLVGKREMDLASTNLRVQALRLRPYFFLLARAERLSLYQGKGELHLNVYSIPTCYNAALSNNETTRSS